MREGRLARAFAGVSGTPLSDDDVEEFLALLCQRFVEVMEASAAGAVLTDRRGRLRVAAASTDTVAALETLQVQRWQGPCVDAYRCGRRVAVPDLRRLPGRWPMFTPWALEAGARSWTGRSSSTGRRPAPRQHFLPRRFEGLSAG